MRSSLVISSLALAGMLVAAPAHAQTAAVAGKALQVTPYAGYMMFGHLADGPLGTSLTSSGAPLYGAQLAMRLMPGISLVGNVGYASGDLKVGVPILGGVDVGSSKALVSDAGVQLDLPAMKSSGLQLAPFVQAGVGAIRYDLALGESVLGGAVKTRATNLAGSLGAGVDIPFGSSAGIRLMAKDYIGKFDMKDATGLDLGGAKTAHNLALTAGLRFDF